MSKVSGLCWNVCYYSYNAKDFKIFNIFEHRSFAECVSKIMTSPWESKRFFGDAVRKELMYYFWSKSEYEIILESWPVGDNHKKIDIYDQVMLNWDRFVDYLWGEINEDCRNKR